MRESLLKSVLSSKKHQSINQVDDFLLNDELDYHFDDYKSEFDFIIEEANDSLIITQIVTCSLVIHPDCDAPLLHQYIEIHDENSIKSSYVRINGEDIDFKKHLIPALNNPKRFELSYDLRPHLKGDSNERILKYKRKATYTQSLSKKPYYCMELMHYAKGFTLEATVSEGYYVDSEGLGCAEPKFPAPKFPAPEVINDNPCKKRWRVRERNQLLFPGYSYMIVVLKEPAVTHRK